MQNTLLMRRYSKGLPQAASLLLLALLCASVAYWGTQFFPSKSTLTEVPIQNEELPVDVNQAATLFGGEGLTTAGSGNYRLMGVLVARNAEDSIAIISADDQPAKAYRVNKQIANGVSVKEVHDKYVVLSEGGAMKRLPLAERMLNKQESSTGEAPTMPRLNGVPPTPPEEQPPGQEKE